MWAKSVLREMKNVNCLFKQEIGAGNLRGGSLGSYLYALLFSS